MNILIIDDSEDIRELVSFVVSEEFPHCKILEASSGNEGVRILKEYGDRIQGIVCDYYMPHGNGIIVFSEWKKNFFHIPFILYSSEIQSAKSDFIKNEIDLHESAQLKFLSKQGGIEPLAHMVRTIPENTYLKLPFHRVKAEQAVSLPVFVSLSGRKMVKHTHQDDIMDGGRLNQLKEKGVNHFFVPFNEAVKKGYRFPFIKVSQQKNNEVDLKEEFQNFKDIHEIALVGILKDPQQLESGFYWLEMSVSNQNENEMLKGYLTAAKQKDNYVIHHSFLILLLSYMALKEMGSNNESCRTILFNGVILHDLLRSDDIAFNSDILGHEVEKSYQSKLEYQRRLEKLMKQLGVESDSFQVMESLVFGLHDKEFRPRMSHKLAQLALICHRISSDLYRENFVGSPQKESFGEKGQLGEIFTSLFKERPSL